MVLVLELYTTKASPAGSVLLELPSGLLGCDGHGLMMRGNKGMTGDAGVG
jgi:hypothetical protein